jgi:DNA-binding NtrC family response regulator
MPTVLFVDDDAAMLRMVPRLFRRDAFEVVTAPHAAAALELLETTAIDVVVSDHRMPGMLGAALLALLAERSPHMGRILLSGDMGAHNVVDPGVAHEVLRKPASPEELRGAIARLLTR